MPMNFVIKNLTEEQIQLLSQNGVATSPFENKFTLLINSVDSEKMATVLGTDILFTRDTAFTGISELILANAPESNTFEINISHWDGSDSNIEPFKKAVEDILIPVIKKNVIMTVPHSQMMEPFNDEFYHIHLWSGPTPRGSRNRDRNTIFGIPVACPSTYGHYEGVGEPIMDDDYLVALVMEDNLYINHDIVHTGERTEIRIFKEILKRAVKLIKEETSDDIQEKFIKNCSSGFLGKVIAETEKIKNYRENLSEIKSHLISRSRELFSSERTLLNLQDISTKQKKVLTKEFQKLSEIKEIESMTMSLGSLKVKTIPLTCKNPHTKLIYDLGQFVINIQFNGSFKIQNITKTVNIKGEPWMAPVVGKNGTLKVDKINLAIPELAASYKYSDLIRMIINCLSIYDKSLEMYWKNITCWPEVKAEPVGVPVQEGGPI